MPLLKTDDADLQRFVEPAVVERMLDAGAYARIREAVLAPDAWRRMPVYETFNVGPKREHRVRLLRAGDERLELLHAARIQASDFRPHFALRTRDSQEFPRAYHPTLQYTLPDENTHATFFLCKYKLPPALELVWPMDTVPIPRPESALEDAFVVCALARGRKAKRITCVHRFVYGFGEPLPIPSVCVLCGACAEHMMVCGKCGRTTYCGKACQRAHWAAHKPRCGKAFPSA